MKCAKCPDLHQRSYITAGPERHLSIPNKSRPIPAPWVNAMFFLVIFVLMIKCSGDLNYGYGEVCGNWQSTYKIQHDAIIAGRLEERVAVAYIDGGIADCLSGAISTFYYALLTGRAFKILGTRWSRAFSTPNVDWRDSRTLAFYKTLIRIPQNNASIVVGGWTPNFASNEMYVAFKSKNLRRYMSSFNTVLFVANLGLTHTLFSNVHHYNELYRMGLRPETAFGCAMNFLFSPHPHVMRPYANIISKLVDPRVMTVGVQVRVGDHVLGVDGSVDLSMYDGFFECADRVKQDFGHVSKPTFYFLVSDSVAVRRHGIRRWGKQALTLPVVAQHVSRNESSMEHAVAENWLLGMCHTFVVSRFSGFGRTAVARSMRWGAVFTLDSRIKDTTVCKVPESYQQWASAYPPFI